MNANILVVDDRPENLQLLIGMLSAQGHEVRAFAEGSFALESAQINPPDIILLDIDMPEMDGYTVCTSLKADPRTCEIPVIFISAYSDVSDKIKGFRVGGVDYITKPFQIDEVLARVQTHLRLRMIHRELQQEVQRRTQAETKLQALNQQLQETNERLEKANSSKDMLFSVLAHDLRSPFAGMLGLTDLVLGNFEQYDKTNMKKVLKSLQTTSKNVHVLLNNLLEWSRLERGLLECQPKTLLISTIVKQNMRLVDVVARQKQITLRNRIPEQLTGYGDEHMTNTILRNLITNAVKYTEAGGFVEISGQSYPQKIEITVTDNGIGMDETALANLFQLDLRKSRPGTQGEKGSGLGLILCKEFVKKNRGELNVESAAGQGSTFRFSLPIAPPLSENGKTSGDGAVSDYRL